LPDSAGRSRTSGALAPLLIRRLALTGSTGAMQFTTGLTGAMQSTTGLAVAARFQRVGEIA
jgi:hypothetical protein